MIKKLVDNKLRTMRTIDDVQYALEKLTKALPTEKMDRVTNFNHTYLIITKKVKYELNNNAFEYPEFLNKFDTIFAKYYFLALRGYAANETIPSSWDTAFDRSAKKKVSNFIAMALGVNAHVNNDIAQVLYDCQAQNKQYKDYVRLNKIIADCIYEVIDELKDDKNPLGPKNIFLKRLYKLTMVVLIKRWRYSAWKNFEALKTGRKSVQDIEKSAAVTANLIARLPL